MMNPLRRLRQSNDERGASLVEAALITPVFLTLIFAILEGGLMFRTNLMLANSVGSGSRTVSIIATSPTSDYQALQRMKAELSSMNTDNIDRIVIFHADGPLDTPSAACQDFGGQSAVGEECNVYTPADWDRPESEFGCQNPNVLDSFWCPTDRSASVANLDMVGVWIRGEHNFATGFFGNDFTMTDQSILSLEPTSR